MKAAILLFAFLLAEVVHGAEKGYYTAAVFEKALLRSVKGKTPQETLDINLKLFKKAAVEAVERNADIVVYGEFALFPYQARSGMANFMEHVPDPNDGIVNPCKQRNLFEDRPILTGLSCIARENDLYVAANMVDAQPCDQEDGSCGADGIESCQNSCPFDGVNMYNTDVAFDRDGNLIARYHKNHLYFEELNIPVNPEYITFKTDFGVTFGLIVCFDSVFKHSVTLVENHGVDTLLFITHWFDDILPFNAIEWQQSWAFGNNVDVLAANVYTPGIGTIGSGIYSKKFGAINYSYNPDGFSKLVVARVPLDLKKSSYLRNKETEVVVITETNVREKAELGDSFPKYCYDKFVGPSKDNLTDYRCFKSLLDQYTLEKLKSGKNKAEACSNGFCCSVSYSADIKNEDYYLAVFNGLDDARDYFRWQEETCLLIRCDSLDGKPCGLIPSKSQSVFDYVKLKASFTAEKIYPTVSKTNNRLAPKNEWEVEKSENTVTLTFKSKSDEPLLKVGLMGRVYSKDAAWIPFYKY